MFNYVKKLQYPINIKHPNPKAASIIISQYGGPDGELGASLRYLSQRYSMPYAELKGLLTDIGVEELGHLEMIGTMVHQLTRNLTEKEIEENPGFAAYFVDHTTGVYPTSASGSPWNAAGMAVKGDVIADLNENLAAEQKARVTYDNILRLVDDPDIIEPIKFLREREIVHYQRFGDTMRQSCKQSVDFWSRDCSLLCFYLYVPYNVNFIACCIDFFDYCVCKFSFSFKRQFIKFIKVTDYFFI